VVRLERVALWAFRKGWVRVGEVCEGEVACHYSLANLHRKADGWKPLGRESGGASSDGAIEKDNKLML
jgi:hypothetical protein